MKLVLDRSALDKLLLDDNAELKLELGNAIIQAFSNKHLKVLYEKIFIKNIL